MSKINGWSIRLSYSSIIQLSNKLLLNPQDGVPFRPQLL